MNKTTLVTLLAVCVWLAPAGRLAAAAGRLAPVRTPVAAPPSVLGAGALGPLRAGPSLAPALSPAPPMLTPGLAAPALAPSPQASAASLLTDMARGVQALAAPAAADADAKAAAAAAFDNGGAPPEDARSFGPGDDPLSGIGFRAFDGGIGVEEDSAPSGRPAPADPLEALREKIATAGMPDEIMRKAVDEFLKMKQYAQVSGSGSRKQVSISEEGQKIRTYLEWLTDMPWSKRTPDRIDLAKAEDLLEASHYGLAAVKERVLEFLAVRKRTGSNKATVLCFSGPPGTGKTSIAGAIAEAMGRRFVRLSLGGVSDETVLRGHTRTYLGSRPGKIMLKMKEAGTVNPVFLLDEVDKVGRESGKGDPMAALLEVLDPKQNDTFADAYLEVPYDLSQALFIVTANYMDKIPPELRDRLEIIEFPGYTVEDKVGIARNHIIPEKRRDHKLAAHEADLGEAAVRRVVEGYTREAGVRGLARMIETIMRKIATLLETGKAKAPGTLSAEDVERYLGPPRLKDNEIGANGVGVATALAVDEHGGSAFNLEVVTYPGAGKIHLRQQMLEMILDSAQNALGFIRSTMAQAWGIADETFRTQDIDIAFSPAGKIDGPSAGITLATAIASRLTGRPVKAGVAMTGELTLTGRVLPIGGLVQKVMAAHRAGYRTVIFPKANLRDAEKIPEEVRRDMRLVAVSSVAEVFAEALESAD